MHTALRTCSTLALALLAAGCAGTSPVDTARVYPGAFGSNGDDDISAINLSAWAFATPANTRDLPVQAARAAAAVDYLAGELSTNPRWEFMSPLTKIQMIQARSEVRRALGIAPAAPSQAVVVALLSAANALEAANPAAARTFLTGPAFVQPPDSTLAKLTQMPFLREANIATQRASSQTEPGSNDQG